jgi:hypothetical protein
MQTICLLAPSLYQVSLLVDDMHELEIGAAWPSIST